MTSRILFVVTGLGIGGAETLLLAIAEEAMKRGDEVVIASLQSDNPLTPRFEAAGLEVVELGASSNRFPVAAILKLRSIIKQRQITFVQGWMYHGNLVAYLASRLAGLKPRTQTAFGIFGVWPDMSTYGKVTGLVAQAGGFLSKRVCRVVYNAVSAATDHEERGYHSAGSLAIGNCIDLDHFQRDSDARQRLRDQVGVTDDSVVAVIAARNHPQKDWPTMLAALSQVDNLHVFAIGHKTEDLPHHDRLHRLGPRDNMVEWYSASDFFVLTSAFGEGTSLGMSEAMSCSLPVIMTDVGDNGQFVEGAGFTVGIGDVADLRDKADRLTRDPVLRHAYSSRARELALEHFSTQKNAQPLFEIFDAAGRMS